MRIHPYLNFDGDCRAAFELYARTLGGKLEAMQAHGGSPMKDHTPPEWHDKILHARLTVGDAVIMGSDAPPEHHEKPQGVWVSIDVDKRADAERIFKALSEKGQVRMPMQQTFWGLFGMTIDRFGTPWMVNCGAGT